VPDAPHGPDDPAPPAVHAFADAPRIRWAATAIPGAAPWSRLLEAERAAGQRLRGEKRQREWFAGRWAARAVLADLGAPDTPLLPDAEGAPVPGRPDVLAAPPPAGVGELEISLSHGARWALAAGHRRRPEDPHLGIDLVDDRDGARAARVLDRHLTDRERELIADDPGAAGLLWGAREAVAKATRTGMFAFALLDVAVEALDRERATIAVGYPGCHLWFGRILAETTLIRALVAPDAATRAREAAARRRARG